MKAGPLRASRQAALPIAQIFPTPMAAPKAPNPASAATSLSTSAAARRRARSDLADPHGVAQGAKPGERGHCLLDRVGGEQPGGQDFATEPGQHLFVESRRQAAGEPLID